MATIDDKVFNSNQFFEARGNTHLMRLDELNALRDSLVQGNPNPTNLGDASARELIRQIFKRSGLGGPRFNSLIEPFAEALLSTAMGEGSVAQWQNAQAGHVARGPVGLGMTGKKPEPVSSAGSGSSVNIDELLK